MNKDKLREAWIQLTSGQTYVLACHVRPDGDTLGSALALAHALRAMGKDVTVLSEDGVPDTYEFIPESVSVVSETHERGFDVGVLVDSEGTKRVGSAVNAVRSAKLTACIDHHVPHEEFGEVRVVDSEASSTAEVIYDLFDAAGVELDQVSATQLMTGLIADTGAFRFANTTARTFNIAARLTALGADPARVAREVYNSKPLRAAKLLGRALSSIDTDPSGRVVWAVVRKSDLDELQATDADTESIVNQVEMVKGPIVTLFFRELSHDNVRVSLRARDGFDVNQVAKAFNGGGHVAAAGCTVRLPFEQARDAVVEEILKWMDS